MVSSSNNARISIDINPISVINQNSPKSASNIALESEDTDRKEDKIFLREPRRNSFKKSKELVFTQGSGRSYQMRKSIDDKIKLPGSSLT